jgi:hypothetical protein
LLPIVERLSWRALLGRFWRLLRDEEAACRSLRATGRARERFHDRPPFK